MLDLFQASDAMLRSMCDCIVRNKQDGVYDGAYKVVKAAFNLRNK